MKEVLGMTHVGSGHWVLGPEGRRGRYNSLEGKETVSHRLWSVAEEPGVFILQRTWRGG